MNYLHELIDISKKTIELQKLKWNFKYCNKFHTRTEIEKEREGDTCRTHTRTSLVVVNIVI